jgi:uncharacterized membrane protein YdjX (TVP38/TMEM64 family)
MAEPAPGRPLRRYWLRRYWLVFGGLLAAFLALFAIVEGAGVPLLTDPSAWLGQGGVTAAAIGAGLLLADVFLPVPSSVVMIAHGALFGVVAGTLLSLAGSLGAAALGFLVGRRSARLLERLVSPAEKSRADELLRRHGSLAVVVSRPIPMLAEAVAILAGASPLGWGKMLAASLAGSLPACLLYALTGATSRNFGSGFLMFGLVLVVAAALWALGRRSPDR